MDNELDHDEAQLMHSLELDQVMYEHSVLLEELALSRDYIKAYASCLTETELFRVASGTTASPAQHLGHMAFTQKHLGKQIGMAFSFKLDLYDDVFASIARPSPRAEMPDVEELWQYMEDIHDVFMSELRYHRKPEALFAIVNHNYLHASFIRDMVLRYGYADPLSHPLSLRVHVKVNPGSAGQLFLPVFAN